jgi:ABC-type amino acid transport substrate-binding protein
LTLSRELRPPAEGLPVADPPASGLVRREMFWIAPVSLTTVVFTLYALLNPRWGADTAAILALPLGVVSLVITIFIDRGRFRQPLLRIPPGRTLVWRLAAAAIAVGLTATVGLWWVQREPDPFDYLSHTVRIGYTTDQYSGWHTLGGRGHTGFDVSVADTLQRRFDFEVDWVRLDDLDDRMEALNGRWRDQQGNLQEPVKLVISNFSITPRRAEVIDFAGPYFVDRQGYLSTTKARRLVDLPTDGAVCVVAGSTGAEYLDVRGWSIVERPSLDACISDFRRNTVQAVSGDSSALAGYAMQQGLDPAQYIAFSDGAEEYGIGLPNNSPRLCAAVSEALDKFLANEWTGVFGTSLKPIGLHIATGADDPNGLTRPARTDACQQPEPWKQD